MISSSGFFLSFVKAAAPVVEPPLCCFSFDDITEKFPSITVALF